MDRYVFVGDETNSNLGVYCYSVNAATSAINLHRSSNATVGTETATTDTQTLGTVNFYGRNSSNVAALGFKITGTQTGSAGANAFCGGIGNLSVYNTAGSIANSIAITPSTVTMGTGSSMYFAPSTSAPVLRVEGSASSTIQMRDTGATSTQRNADILNDGGKWYFRGRSDADDATTFNILTADLSSGFVGVNTTAPDVLFHIHKATAGTVAADSSSTLALESDGTNYLTFLSPNTATQGILFGDPDSNSVGGIFYDHAQNDLSFKTNATVDRMLLNSAGSLGLGTVTPLNTFDDLTADANGIHIDGQQVARFIAEGSVSAHASLYNSGGTSDKRWFNIEHSSDKTHLLALAEAGTTAQTFLSMDHSTGFIGVNIVAPATLFHISTTSSSVTASADADELFIENNGNAGITIGSKNDALGSIYFGDAQSNKQGYIEYNHNGGKLALGTAGANAILINSSGAVGMGIDVPLASLHIAAATLPALRIDATATGGTPQLEFYEGATLSGYIQYRNSAAASEANIMRVGGVVAGSQLAFWTAGSEAGRFDASGNFGINTTAPFAAPYASQTGLHIAGALPSLFIDGTTAAKIILKDNGYGTADQKTLLIQTVSGKTYFNASADDFASNPYAFLTFDHSNGNVGIGTAAPLTQFEINSTFPNMAFYDSDGDVGKKMVRVGASNGLFSIAGRNDTNTGAGTVDSYLQFSNAGVLTLPAGEVHMTGGNVGMGTAAPNAALQVRRDTGTSNITITSDDNIASLYLQSDNDNTPVDRDVLIRLATHGTTRFALGIDDSDGDKFEICGGDGLGSNIRFALDSSGYVYTPSLQGAAPGSLKAVYFNTGTGELTYDNS